MAYQEDQPAEEPEMSELLHVWLHFHLTPSILYAVSVSVVSFRIGSSQHSLLCSTSQLIIHFICPNTYSTYTLMLDKTFVSNDKVASVLHN